MPSWWCWSARSCHGACAVIGAKPSGQATKAAPAPPARSGEKAQARQARFAGGEAGTELRKSCRDQRVGGGVGDPRGRRRRRGSRCSGGQTAARQERPAVPGVQGAQVYLKQVERGRAPGPEQHRHAARERKLGQAAAVDVERGRLLGGCGVAQDLAGCRCVGEMRWIGAGLGVPPDAELGDPRVIRGDADSVYLGRHRYPAPEMPELTAGQVRHMRIGIDRPDPVAFGSVRIPRWRGDDPRL